MIKQSSGDDATTTAEWFIGPMVVNIISASSKPATMNTDYHQWRLPIGAKTVGEGGLELALMNFV